MDTVFLESSDDDYRVKHCRQKNRRMLYNVMTAAGFTNLPSEWWHYDYGDNMWAQLTGGKAIYAGILDADVRGKV